MNTETYKKFLDAVDTVCIECGFSGEDDEGCTDCPVQKTCEQSELDSDTRLPVGYAEVEYEDFESAEAVDGARFDDLNYQHYMER